MPTDSLTNGATVTTASAGGAVRADYVHSRIANGVEFAADLLPRRDTAAIVFRVLTGLADEPAELAGVNQVVERTLSKGTRKYSGQALADEFDAIGADQASFSGRQSVLVRLICLPEFVDRAVDLTAEMLCRPTFPDEACRVAVDLSKQELRSSDDDPGEVNRRLIQRITLGDVYGREPSGEEATLDRITPERVREHWRMNYGARRLQVSAAGPIDAETLARRIERAFGGFGEDTRPARGPDGGAWPRRADATGDRPVRSRDATGERPARGPDATARELDGTGPSNVASGRRTGRRTADAPRGADAPACMDDGRRRVAIEFTPRRQHQQKDLQQQQIAITLPGLPRDDPRFPVEQALIGVLSGGMSGRLFTEVREKQGLVYWVSAWHEQLPGIGVLHVRAASTPERCGQTFKTLVREIERLSEDLTQAELERARHGLIAHALTNDDVTRSRAAGLSEDLFFHGRPVGLAAKVEALRGVSLVAVREYAATFSTQRVCVATLGPKELEAA